MQGVVKIGTVGEDVGRQLVRPSGRQLEGPSLAGGLVSDN